MLLWIKQSPGRMITAGFAVVILTGTLLLLLPVSQRAGVELQPVDALFTATSATCVTGLVTVDIAETYSAFGQAVVAFLIQVGGLGVACMGVWLILLLGGRVSLKNRMLVKEAWNVSSLKGMLPLVRRVIMITILFEGAGAVLSYFVFSQDYPWTEALRISVFHAVSAFNNAGLDLLGNMQSLTPYRNDVFLNVLTAGLIIAGGLGFLVFLDIGSKMRTGKWTLHTKVVIGTTAVLIAGGTVVFRIVERLPWLEAFFLSVSSRTAGFSTISIGALGSAGLFFLCLLMFVGASPGSTGGGIKTTTFFVLFQMVRGLARGKSPCAYNRNIPQKVVSRACMILVSALTTVCLGTFLLCAFEPGLSFLDCLTEVISAFATVGLSAGITPELGVPGKLLITIIMYLGRVGPLTILSLSAGRTESAIRYSEENIMVG